MDTSRQTTLGDRRSKARFSIELEVRYRIRGRRRYVYGIGRTLNISSSGFLVASQDEIPTGAKVDAIVVWPYLLEGITRLQLVTAGKIVRRGPSSFAVAFACYEFRTMKRETMKLEYQT